MTFSNDIAVQKAMRSFSSLDLARIIMYNPDMKECFKRNMNDVCWNFVNNFLEELDKESPAEAFCRFVVEYKAEEMNNG
jgi:hypothetical protein